LDNKVLDITDAQYYHEFTVHIPQSIQSKNMSFSCLWVSKSIKLLLSPVAVRSKV